MRECLATAQMAEPVERAREAVAEGRAATVVMEMEETAEKAKMVEAPPE